MERKGKGEVVLQAKKQKNVRQEKQVDDLKESKQFKNYATGEREWVVVKCDTEIPTLPGKSERHKNPDE